MHQLFQASMLCFLLCLPVLITAVPVSSLDEEQDVEIQLLHESSNPRQKRSASDSSLPDHLVFKLPVSGEDVVLRMKRSKMIPVYTSDGEVNYIPDESGVYTDASRESAMIVKRSTRGYTLSGIFNHGNTAWNLKPWGHIQSAASHRLIPQHAKGREVISFANDEYFDTEERPELIATPLRSRSKRAVTQHVIELAFIVDYQDYSKWIDFVGASNALSDMRLWYTYVSESINIRYDSIQDSAIAINTRTTFIRILTNPSEATFISDLVSNDLFSGSAGLAAFRSWIISQGSAIPTSDHYMLFTGYDIIGATGIAYGDRVCTSSGVSISENTFQATLGGIAAHELGHSLSAQHDSQEGCDDNDDFIMAAILSTPVGSASAGNPWKFSSCSIAKFSSYLSGVSCTLPENTSQNEELPPPVAGQRAGEVLSRDQQCVNVFRDSASSFCDRVQEQQGGIETLCGGMYCAIPGRPGTCQTTLPQEYTTCGTDKWCVRGFCVDVEVDTTTPEPTTTPTTTTTTTTTTTPAPTTTPTTTTTTTTPAPTTTPTTTTTTTTPAPTTTPTTTTTTTTPEPTTTPTTTTTTTTPAPTTTPTTTTTTTTPAPTTTPTTTTTTTTPEPTTTPTTTTTTTTPEPTTTPTTTTPEPTTTPTTTTTTTTPEPTPEPTTTTTAVTTTTSTTRRPTTTTPTTVTTTLRPTTTTTTNRPTPTTTRDPRPSSISDCFVFIYRRDWRNWWACVRFVIFRQNQMREQQERQREREQERQDNRPDNRRSPKEKNNNQNNKGRTRH